MAKTQISIRQVKIVFREIKINFRKLVNRLPPKLRAFGGPLLGGIIGLIGGIPGFFIGLLLGYLLRELFVQSFRNRRILDYLTNPGQKKFYEAEPGMAAWCALAVIVVAADTPDSPSAAERILKQVVLEASCIFTSRAADPFLIEHFSQLALLGQEKLNPYLLAESLTHRRTPMKDLQNLGWALSRLATGEKARRLAREMCLILSPSFESDSLNDPSGDPLNDPSGDPWKILGLSPGTSRREVKSHYRRLAKLYHPDKLEILDKQHRETAALAFVKIKESYERIVGEG